MTERRATLGVASGFTSRYVPKLHTPRYLPAADVAANTEFLRNTFSDLVRTSAALPPEERLVMYDACDEHEVKAPLGAGPFRKRLDARRNTKPKKPDAQVLVCTPFDAAAFNFSKIKNPAERIATLPLGGGGDAYHLLTNKFPLFKGHMLLVADAKVPQQMTAGHLDALATLLGGCELSAYFNSWCASASVNHFHCHLIDEVPPVATLPLVPGATVLGRLRLRPDGFPGECHVFSIDDELDAVADVVRAMQADNQPHNLVLASGHVYVFPKPLVRPARSFELYPETVGGPELAGSFTVYRDDDYEALSWAAADELFRLNTAPLPKACLVGEGGAPGVARANTWDGIHAEAWPQDRPIAKALLHNLARPL